MSRTIVDVHVLQTVPPSNINRDDSGSPKTAVFGGTRRARVSSQAWKRATRRAFDGLLDRDQLGVRTKDVVSLVSERVRELSDLDEAMAETVATAAVTAADIKVAKPTRGKGADEKAPQSSYLLFLSRGQVDQLARLGLEAHTAGTKVDGKRAKLAADSRHSVDLALFGRMVADASDLNVDAACQVAHAVSVHAVDSEFDYFTAVDDRAPEDNTGAGMIGTNEFSSSTLYRYASVDVDLLRRTLDDTGGEHDATAAAVAAFVRSFATSMPTGKQTTFAHRTLPDALVVQVRDRQPVNLVGAFEEAVELDGDGSRLQRAAQRLVDHARELDTAFGTTPVATWVVGVGAAGRALAPLGEQVNLDLLVDDVARTVSSRSSGHA